jgi:PEP-CTERM motif
MKLSGIIALAAVVLLSPLGAGASALLYDQNLATPNGVFYGSGNVNGGWTVADQNIFGVELGLRAKYRFGSGSSTDIHSSTDVYDVPVGVNAGKALWNYDWSINLINTGGWILSSITAQLTITDVNSGISKTIDPLSYWKDNAGWGYPSVPGNPVTVNLGGLKTAPGLTVWGAQNSENPNFADFPLSAGFNALQAGKEYEFDLKVFNNSGLMASDTMFVNTTVPEPASLFMIGSGLLLAGLYRRRKGVSA